MKQTQRYYWRQCWVAAIFVSWAAFSTAALFLVGNQYYGTFAPEGAWQDINPQALTTDGLGLTKHSGFHIVHVRQKGCKCNRQADQFRIFLAGEHIVNKYEQHDIDIDQLAKMDIVLPASPAVLIFQHGQLIYAGPYASGPLCTVDENIITPILQEKTTLAGLWLNGETKSCRCINAV
jgi:hypothetical protein